MVSFLFDNKCFYVSSRLACNLGGCVSTQYLLAVQITIFTEFMFIDVRMGYGWVLSSPSPFLWQIDIGILDMGQIIFSLVQPPPTFAGLALYCNI